MTALVHIATALLLMMVTIAIVNVIFAPRLNRYDGWPAQRPRVSLLVPARDEAHNLWRTLPLLLSSDWHDLEILVLDDCSSDRTAAIVATFAAAHPHRLRLLRGRPTPAGWLGKSWACHQLAQHARGQLFIFCDADVSVSRSAVRRTVLALQAHAADVATGLPAQRFTNRLAAAVVPIVMHIGIGAALVLPLVARTRTASLAVGNGQWLAFTRSSYRRIGGHAATAAAVAEDMALARAAKRRGLRLLPLVADADLAVSMYAAPRHVWHGFRKNLYAIAGASPIAFTAVLLVFTTSMLLPFALPFVAPLPYALVPLALLVAVRLLVAQLFRGGTGPVMLHPFGAVVVAAVAVASAIGAARGTLAWKGRTLSATAVQEGGK
jgi:chlorobactene glucosyltransferase